MGEREWWEYGETCLVKVYEALIGWLRESGDTMDWADDSAVWCDVMVSGWGGPDGYAAHANDLRFDMDLFDGLDMADYLNHWDTSDRPAYQKLADWMCERWKGHRPRHMRSE